MISQALIKPTVYRNKKYLAFVRQFPCLVCGSERDIQACHTGPHGLGSKASDLRAVNLCAEHHLGNRGLDQLGREKFEDFWIVDLRDRCLELLNLYLTGGNTL